MESLPRDGIIERSVDRRLSRRLLLQGSGAGIAAAATAPWLATAARAQNLASTPSAGAVASPVSGAGVPIIGQAVPELAAFDTLMTDLMARFGLPGGQLALAKEGRLVFDHAYGLADVEADEAFQPDSLCRIASVSKTITVVATLTLVDAGRLALDDRAFRLLADLQPPTGAPLDPRLDEITIQNLIQHAGGWDAGFSDDPQYMPLTWQEAGLLGVEAPPSAEQIIRAMKGVPLDFDPGTKTVYSNFGYNVLGRVIERVSGQSYEAYVQERVFAPAGITDMRLGRTRLADRAPGEVRYYAPPGHDPVALVFPGEGYGPDAYGGISMEAIDAHGGWIASAADLIRFVTAIDGQRGAALLRPATFEAMLRAPKPASGGEAGAGNAEADSGLGWVVQHVGDGFDWSHAGALSGSNGAWLARTADGLAFAYVFNLLPKDFGAFFGASISALRDTAAAVGTWPDHDLFATGG